MLKDMIFFADMKKLPYMLDTIMQEVTQYVSDKKLLNRLKLCCEEILANIIDYAYTEKQGNIYVSCEYFADKHSLQFVFADEGTPYDPLAQKCTVDLEAGIEERPIGGLGIFLYTTIMDKVEYKYMSQKNHLILEKNLPREVLVKPRKKIAILMESDFYEPEIEYYSNCFNDAGFEVHFLSRLWGNDSLTFHGHEERKAFQCSESFEFIEDRELREYAAVIIPAGYTADRLRYTEDINKLPPACVFLQRCFHDKHMLKGIICHGAWLMAPIHELVKGRKMVVHNNLLGDAQLMGIDYVDEDVVVDADLVSARSGGEHQAFAQKIIALLKTEQ
ncbi:MAG: ATP-binding protein [Pelosinus sp.]|nr:ATP-binding protein [Pelosinus sp.]